MLTSQIFPTLGFYLKLDLYSIPVYSWFGLCRLHCICSVRSSTTYCFCYIFQVFMRNSVFEPLEEKRFIFLRKNAIILQTYWRGFVIRRSKYFPLIKQAICDYLKEQFMVLQSD